MDTNPTADNPISKAEAASIGYTRAMHNEMHERLMQQIQASQQSSRTTDPQILDLYETAIYHAAYSDDPVGALYLYDDQLGGYQHVGGRLGDYRRGLRITVFLMNVLGADYMDVLACPAHDHNLYLLALGQPLLTEQQSIHLLEHARKIAQLSHDENTNYWKNPLSYFREYTNRAFVMYEAVLLQTQCDAFLAQGKLQAAEEIINTILDQPREWGVYGRPDKSRNGANPYARRALARVLMGNVEKAFEDFKLADGFAVSYTPFLLFPSRDWHHRTHFAAFLARLGYLSGAQNCLDRMNIDRIRTYRPLTTAEFDLASAEIAYARGNYIAGTEYARHILDWANSSGHKQTYVRALLLLAKLRLRAHEFVQADELLSEAKTGATTAGFVIQQLDALILTGYLALATDDIDRAKAAGTEIAETSQQLVYRWGIGDATHLLARCAEIHGEMEEALRYARQALSVRNHIQDPKAAYTQAIIDRNRSNTDLA